MNFGNWDAGNWATVIVALIALGSAYLSNRASRHSTKTQAETEAYIRARKIDIETIDRQEKQLEKLRTRVLDLEASEERLNEDNDRLRSRVTRLERKLEELGHPVE